MRVDTVLVDQLVAALNAARAQNEASDDGLRGAIKLLRRVTAEFEREARTRGLELP